MEVELQFKFLYAQFKTGVSYARVHDTPEIIFF